MLFRKKLQYFLVKTLKISNKAALKLIFDGKIEVNNKICQHNIEITETDEIAFENRVLQKKKQLLYMAFYKPIGIETTLNAKISQNLLAILPQNYDLFPVGRLDKESEGLLLLTNDGKIYDKILKSENNVEKEYFVTVNKPITDYFISEMAAGVTILGKKTLCCSITKISEYEFSIILKQGINRQIRRMCYKLDYEVVNLKRIRICNTLLADLRPTEFRFIDKPSS